MANCHEPRVPGAVSLSLRLVRTHRHPPRPKMHRSGHPVPPWRCGLRVAGATAWLHVLGDDTPTYPTPELARRGVEACATPAVPAGIECGSGPEKQSSHGPESRRASLVRMLAIASRAMTGRFGNPSFKVKTSRQQ